MCGFYSYLTLQYDALTITTAVSALSVLVSSHDAGMSYHTPLTQQLLAAVNVASVSMSHKGTCDRSALSHPPLAYAARNLAPATMDPNILQVQRIAAAQQWWLSASARLLSPLEIEQTAQEILSGARDAEIEEFLSDPGPGIDYSFGHHHWTCPGHMRTSWRGEYCNLLCTIPRTRFPPLPVIPPGMRPGPMPVPTVPALPTLPRAGMPLIPPRIYHAGAYMCQPPLIHQTNGMGNGVGTTRHVAFSAALKGGEQFSYSSSSTSDTWLPQRESCSEHKDPIRLPVINHGFVVEDITTPTPSSPASSRSEGDQEGSPAREHELPSFPPPVRLDARGRPAHGARTGVRSRNVSPARHGRVQVEWTVEELDEQVRMLGSVVCGLGV